MSVIVRNDKRITDGDVVRLLQQYKANVQRYLGCRVHLAFLSSGEIDWYLSNSPSEHACLNDQVRAGLFIKFFDRWFGQLPLESRRVLFHCYINHDFELANTMSAWLEFEWGRIKFKTLPVRCIAIIFDCSTARIYKMKRNSLEMLAQIINNDIEREGIR